MLSSYLARSTGESAAASPAPPADDTRHGGEARPATSAGIVACEFAFGVCDIAGADGDRHCLDPAVFEYAVVVVVVQHTSSRSRGVLAPGVVADTRLLVVPGLAGVASVMPGIRLACDIAENAANTCCCDS